MVKMNGCAAIDSARPFRFLADKAAVAADFHLENDACYHGKRRIASTASVATLAKTGVVRPRFPCRIASTAGVCTLCDFRLGKQGTAVPTLHTCQYVKTYLASNACVDTHRAFCKFQLRCLLKKLVGQHPKPFNDFFKIGYVPPELNITLSWKVTQGFFEYPHKFLLGSF